MSFLALLSDDQRLSIYAPAAGNSWVPVCCVSDLLYQHLSQQWWGNSAARPGVVDAEYRRRVDLMTSLAVAWSPLLPSGPDGREQQLVLAVGGRSQLTTWRLNPFSAQREGNYDVALISSVAAPHASWTTAVSWYNRASPEGGGVLVTGSADGSVTLWACDPSAAQSADACRLSKKLLEPDMRPVSSFAWLAGDVPVLAVGKGTKVLLLQPTRGTVLYGVGNQHTGMVTALAWNADRRVLFSAAADATVRTWDLTVDDADGGPATQLVCGRVVLQDAPNKGLFGLVLSCNGLYCGVLQKIPGNRSSMYEYSGRSFVKIVALDGQETSAEEAVALCIAQPERPWISDVVMLLSDHTQQPRDLMADAAAETQRIFRPLAERTAGLLSLLEDGYAGRLAAAQALEPAAALDLQLRLVNLLRFSTQLATFALRRLPTEVLGLEDRAALVGKLDRTVSGIGQLHLLQCLRTFFLLSGLPGAQPPQQLERRSLVLMCDAVAREPDACLPVLVELAETTRRRLGVETYPAPAADVEEACGICQEPLAWVSTAKASCRNGHISDRCCRTLLALTTPHVLFCAECKRKSLPVPAEIEPDLLLPEMKLGTFLWLPGAGTCPYCNVQLVVRRYSTFLKAAT